MHPKPCSVCITSSNPHNHPHGKGTVLPFFRWENHEAGLFMLSSGTQLEQLSESHVELQNVDALERDLGI